MTQHPFLGEPVERFVAAALGRVTVDRTFDVPYMAGSSVGGSTVFIDRGVPAELTSPDGKTSWPVAPFIVAHEVVEKRLTLAGFTYEEAHSCATVVEEAAVAEAGIPMEAYEAFTQEWVGKCRAKEPQQTPRQLDPLPYAQCGDAALWDRIKAVMA